MLMKRAIAIILETIVFLFVFLAGTLLVAVPTAHLPNWDVNLSGTRYFVLDGIVFMSILYVLFLLLGMARHRLRSAVLTSTVAVVLALVLGLAMKFGFATR
jgi:surface polysaccharide O-acyltransferase-like enzyme